MVLDAGHKTLQCFEVLCAETAFKRLWAVTSAEAVKLPLWTARLLDPPLGPQDIAQIHAQNWSIVSSVQEAGVRIIVIVRALGRSYGRHLL
jgi:hypothetical protein